MTEQKARWQRRVLQQAFRSVPGRLPCPSRLLLWLGLVLTQSLFASSVDGFVQYKVSYANREKCGFDECSHTDPPRLHKYHQQTTELTYWNYSYFQASNTTNVALSGTCGPGTH